MENILNPHDYKITATTPGIVFIFLTERRKRKNEYQLITLYVLLARTRAVTIPGSERVQKNKIVLCGCSVFIWSSQLMWQRQA